MTDSFDLQKREEVAYLMEPGQFVKLGIRPDVALKVNVGAFLDVFRIQSRTHFQGGNGCDCNQD